MNVDGEEGAIERTIFSLANHYHFNSNENVLKTKYYIGAVPFHFNWKLTKSSADVVSDIANPRKGNTNFHCFCQFYEEITRKLLVSLLNARDQKNELIDIVKRKDVEINQYKIEGATLMRSVLSQVYNRSRKGNSHIFIAEHIATQPFDKSEFDRKHELVSGSFELAKDDMDNWANIKNMCNYNSLTKANDKGVR